MTTHYQRYQARTRRAHRIQLLLTAFLVALGVLFTAAAAWAFIVLVFLTFA